MLTDPLAQGFESLLLLVGLICIPAIVIFGVIMYRRSQHSKFRRGSRSRHRSSSDKPTDD